ncbi:MAG: 4-alpha-glucanotransferase [Planctomyces sp.]|nr:4-alpha-glucanotransferase [Planctomyces sp.]
MRRRRSGLLLHVSSLPGRFGIGDLGPDALRWIEQLARARQSVWQILPLGPTGYGDSPYQCFSAFAGNPLFISPERLIEDGLLPDSVLKDARRFKPGPVDFERVTPWRMARLREAFAAFSSKRPRKLTGEFDEFRQQSDKWLGDYALFMALRDRWPDRSWTDWPEELRSRGPEALHAARREFSEGVGFHEFCQFLFLRQWTAVREAAQARSISIMGDVPIFVSHESSDVWANQSQFELDARGRPIHVAGVPPDYFSETGQRWGNPLYRWDRMEADGFRWWIDRLAGSLTLVDFIRLDHFRGFEAYWEIPAAAPTAATGRWVPGPREKLFRVLRDTLGELPLIAEDLGVITPAVEQLRDDFQLPGMRVLQFAFSGDNEVHRPHRYVANSVAYTGTHDNDTTWGWFHAEPGKSTTQSAREVAAERRFAQRYFNSDGSEIHWTLIRAVWQSVADLAIAPVQDVLGLGSEARMNLPGTGTGNWRWRLRPGQLKADAMQRLADLTGLYDRNPACPIEEAPPSAAVKPRRVRSRVRSPR